MEWGMLGWAVCAAGGMEMSRAVAMGSYVGTRTNEIFLLPVHLRAALFGPRSRKTRMARRSSRPRRARRCSSS